ncbi:Protein FAM22 [Cricetulus griseus]|uniref:Protein FAM22 n=1 Tax=Cricetulus griseus TaxID=10029 RepID=G3IBW7_CRIGR|nr:Protein FAM22 [Cricetulus griseus]
MKVEECLWRGLQEWQYTSNYDRMIFFEMAEKFTEFESSEEKENSRLEMMRSIKCQVLATAKQDAPRPPAPEVFEEPGEPTEKEEEENSEPEQEEDDFYSDAGVLCYIDELCSQKHFVDQVEDIINPQFVAEILSSKPEMDILSLMKELEYEEEFSFEQIVSEG